MKTAEARDTVNLIRKLIRTHGVVETAKIVGRSKSSVSNIKNGRRRSDYGVLISDLEPRVITSPKLCRKCGEPHRVFSKNLICLECEVIVMINDGTVEGEICYE